MKFKDTHTETRTYLDKTGVYSISHEKKPDGFYIGMATCNKKRQYKDFGFLARWRNNFSCLNRGIHNNKELQSVVNTYGITGLKFNIIEFCEPSECPDRETYFIQLYRKSYTVYNFSNFSNPLLGTKQSKETIEKRISHKRKKVYQYDMNGFLICEWISVSEAARSTGLSVSNISSACNRVNGSCAGFQWSYVKSKKKKHIRHVTIKHKGIYQYSLDGILLNTFKTISDAKEKTGIKYQSILRGCNGTHETAAGYKWSFNQLKTA